MIFRPTFSTLSAFILFFIFILKKWILRNNPELGYDTTLQKCVLLWKHLEEAHLTMKSIPDDEFLKKHWRIVEITKVSMQNSSIKALM